MRVPCDATKDRMCAMTYVMWCHSCDHTMVLPDGIALVHDSALMTSLKFKGEMVELRGTTLEDGEERTDKDRQV